MTSANVQLVKPAYANFPAWSETYGPEVADLAAWAGFAPDPEQVLALDALFGIDSDGKSVAFEFAVICPRQNMKTGLFKMACLGWLFITKQELIVWSAHEMGTTREAFRDLVNLIEGTPALAKRLELGPTNGIFRGSGQEAIAVASSKDCPNGQRVKFKARTHGGGRGLTGNKVLLDEGFALQPSHMGSLLPTLSAVPDPQVVVGSSAGHASSEVLRGIRDRGRAGGDPRLGYMEFCAPDPEVACAGGGECSHALGVAGCGLDNMAYLRRANPAIGRRITEDYLRDERRALPPSEYGRERAGWWDEPDIADSPLISRETWAGLVDKDSAPTDPVSFGVYVNRDRTHAAIGVAAYRSDGLVHVEIVPAAQGKSVDSLPGTGWIPDRVKELADKWRPCATVIDNYSAAGSLITAIEELGVTVEATGASEMAKACGNFFDFVTEGKLRHRGEHALGASVCTGRRRDLMDSWAWDRKDRTGDITQLVAVTLALHGLIVHGRQPAVEVWSFYS